MSIAMFDRLRTAYRSRDGTRRRSAPVRRPRNDPLAPARGLMVGFVLSLLLWALIVLGLVWLA
ncbi:hypothetical protein D3218_13875 [Aureimonas flava]|uniref:Uncharacterized protein n=1 Tax=Aureimonas flava TaxID=2320271 RepID=A0A3A1WGN2_9HYPH|nr:hypothetical protein [Aureimonas flava]RIX99556.1 hypothetical protein D3218_13875 [Aureimonas flava]